MFNSYYLLCANLVPSGALTYNLEAKLQAADAERQAEIDAMEEQ